MGIWILIGLLTFLSIEKVFPDDDDDDQAAAHDNKRNPKTFTIFEHVKVCVIVVNIIDQDDLLGTYF